MVAAPNLWNNLPLEIRKAPNIDNFKTLLLRFQVRILAESIFRRIKKTSTLEPSITKNVSYTVKHLGGGSVGKREDRVRVGIVERTSSVFSTRP